MVLFATDLDNTLIYSYKDAKENDVCVETKDGKELSFMPRKAYELLREVAEKCVFVPVTTRSLEQYRRINLSVTPRYAIAAHGALLITDGIVDDKWTAKTRELINAELPRITANDLIYDIRYVEDFFIFAKSSDPASAVMYLKDAFGDTDFMITGVHNKVYLIPRVLNKGVAVARLKEKLGASIIICAGDSELDTPMLEAADIALVPDTNTVYPFEILKTVNDSLY